MQLGWIKTMDVNLHRARANTHNKQYLHINERGAQVSLATRKPAACLLRLARAFPANAINHHLQTGCLN